MELNLQHAPRVPKNTGSHTLEAAVHSLFVSHYSSDLFLKWMEMYSSIPTAEIRSSTFVIHGSLVNMKPDSNFRAGHSRQTEERFRVGWRKYLEAFQNKYASIWWWILTIMSFHLTLKAVKLLSLSFDAAAITVVKSVNKSLFSIFRSSQTSWKESDEGFFFFFTKRKK